MFKEEKKKFEDFYQAMVDIVIKIGLSPISHRLTWDVGT